MFLFAENEKGQKMKIINTCDKIKSVFADGFDINLWREYAGEISIP